MPDFAVSTTFRARDKISPAFTRMGNSADNFRKRASYSFNRASRSASGFGNVLRRLGPYLSGYMLFRFANQSIEAWKNQESAVSNLEAGLKSTNNAIGLTSKRLQGMASDWQKVGIFADEDIIQNVTAQLLTFGSITKDNFNEMQAAAMDITAKLYGIKASGEQLRDVTIMLGKAMDDPARGMTALRRRGIQFTKQQMNMIKVMQQVEGREKAQAYLLKEINKLYGGTNIALRNTSAGMERAAHMQLGDTMERLGKELMPVKIQLLQLANLILPKIADALPYIIGFIKKFGAAIPMLIIALKTWKTVQIGLNAVLIANPIGLIIMGIYALTMKIKNFHDQWKQIEPEFLKSWETVKQGFSGFVDGIKNGFSRFINYIRNFISQLVGYIQKIPGVGSMVENYKKYIGVVKKFQDQKNQLASNMTAPNAGSSEKQSIRFSGELNINNAPTGSTVTSQTRGAARPIQMNLVGVNP